MRKLIILSIITLPLIGFASETCCPATKPTATCPMSNLPPAPTSQEIYDFSCMELLRLSILIQAEKEELEKELVANGIDKLGEDIIEANIDDLMEVSTEIEADEAMMKLFKAKMEGKTLKKILKIN